MTASLATATGQPSQRIAQQILDYLSDVPHSREQSREHPGARVEAIALAARRKAFLASSSLALPPGPVGWLTVLPELVAIWKIQAQMVSDIAAAYGQHSELGREQMLWCLFRHTAAQAFRDLVIRMGDRLLFRRMSYAVAERVAKRVGVKITQRTVGKGLSRWLPVVGALGVGAYAYYDTGQVASTAIAMFGGEFHTEGGDDTGSTVERQPGAVRRARDAVVEKASGGAARVMARVSRARGEKQPPPK